MHLRFTRHSLQSRIILFVAIIGCAMIIVALAMGTDLLSGNADEPYTADDLRATAVALDVRATEIAVAATRVATDGDLPSSAADPLETSASSPTDSPPPTDNDMGSRQRPVSFGETFDTADGLRISVLGTNYDAWPLVLAENSLNDQPAEGMRMVMVEAQVSNLDGSDDQAPRRVSSGDFRIVGSRGIVYTPFASGTRCGVIPNELDYEIFTGATVSGNICVVAPEDETDFLLVYRSSSDWGETAIYFELPSPALRTGASQVEQNE